MVTPSSWLRFDIKIPPEKEDELTALFYRMDFFTGLEVIPENQFLKLRVYFEDSGIDQEQLYFSIKNEIVASSIDRFSFTGKIKRIVDEDWEHKWRRNLKPIKVTDSLIINQTWNTVEHSQGKIILTIDPEMAFGTGLHESTRLSIRLMEQIEIEGKSFLDAGTGTGILGMYAVKLGAKKVTAVDYDPFSIKNTKKNLKRNGLEGEVLLFRRDISKGIEDLYDVITANLQSNIILNTIDLFKNALVQGGSLILSGILKNEKDEMKNAFSIHGFKIVNNITEGDWIAFSGNFVNG